MVLRSAVSRLRDRKWKGKQQQAVKEKSERTGLDAGRQGRGLSAGRLLGRSTVNFSFNRAVEPLWSPLGGAAGAKRGRAGESDSLWLAVLLRAMSHQNPLCKVRAAIKAVPRLLPALYIKRFYATRRGRHPWRSLPAIACNKGDNHILEPPGGFGGCQSLRGKVAGQGRASWAGGRQLGPGPPLAPRTAAVLYSLADPPSLPSPGRPRRFRRFG